jgi:hypothetical protein
VAHRGWSALKDAEVLRRVRVEDLTIVTNSCIDFRPMLEREEDYPRRGYSLRAPDHKGAETLCKQNGRKPRVPL